MIRLRALMCELKAHNADDMTFKSLDLETVELRVCTDARFANNNVLPSSLEWCFYAADGTGRFNLLLWSSRKCRRVIKSTLSAELFALNQGHDTGLALRHSPFAWLGRDVKISVFIYSKGV